MATFTVKKWKCDRCGIVVDGDRPKRPWGESARYSVTVSVDYGTAGGTEIDWKEMCNDCDREVGTAIPSLRKPAPDADGWIPWGGGECPVDGNEVVEVRLREYDETPIAGADCFGWSHDGGYDDIIAYRIVKEPADGNG